MKRIIRILIPLFLIGIPVLGMELGFKLSGGYAFLADNSIMRSLEDWTEWKKMEAEGNPNWQYLGQDIKSLHSGIHLEGELLFSFSQRLGISVGTGYIYSDLQESETEVLVQRPYGVLSQVHPITVTAYPVILSGYYFIPVKNKLNIYIRGGAGMAWAKYVNREATKFESSNKYNYFRLESASAKGPVLLGGLGFVYETDMGVRFFCEGLYRRAKIRGFSGENELQEKGILYYFEEYTPNLDFWQTKIKIFAKTPTGANFRSVSEAEVDFSGLSVKIGFIIRF
jgi:hypothetical protein